MLGLFASAIFTIGLTYGQTYAHVYDFIGAGADGSSPYGAVTFDRNGNMYGTTSEGGVNFAGDVWEITNTGTYVELYSFGNGSDGSYPYGNVVFDSNGNMYGTTAEGGANGKGIVWEISAAGVYSDIHDFGSGTDGKFPQAGVTVDSSGNLYGTALSGGVNGFGIVWEISTTSGYLDVHDFGSGTDGRLPKGNVVFDSSGTMYGTASTGGIYSSSGGIVWKLTSGSVYSDIHDFGDGTDGQNPSASIAFDSSGNLIGTTDNGGLNSAGTIWKITSGGTYSDIHDFGVGLDGQNPTGSPTFDSHGNFFGTASNGGGAGYGMVWEISSSGTYSDVYDFQAGTDSQNPSGNVTFDGNGNMYGTATYGGASGSGTVWELAYKPTTLSLSSAIVTGGSSTVGIVRLEVPATVATTVTLSSSSNYAIVPPNITIPVGSQYATFPIWTDPCSATQSATITATNGADVPTASLSLTAYSPYVFIVQVAPTYIVGGTQATGLVQIDHYVTTVGGEIVDLSSSNVFGGGSAAATVPASVVVPFGANSTTFPIATSAVSSITGVSITATDGASQSGLIMLTPAGALGIGLNVNPGGIYGGASAVGTITLNAAQGSPTTVSLSANSSQVTVPNSVTIPAGSTSATFPVSTTAVTSQGSVTNASWIWIACAVGITSQATNITLYPAVVHTVSTSPTSVTGGGTATGTVTISGTAPSGGASVSLSSSSPDLQVPATVVIPAGGSSITFPITTSRINSTETLSINASYGAKTVSCGFGIGASVAVKVVSISPSTVTGGTTTTGTVTLSAVAPASGTTVTLLSSDPSTVVPPTLLIPAGSLSATFPITTTAVAVNTSVSVSAALNGHSANCGLIVAVPNFIGLGFVGPTTVAGGVALTTTVTLNGPAPSTGITIALSSNSASAVVPPSVYIQPGATTATFVIQTSTVTAPTTVTITGVHNQTLHLTFKLTSS
jgi:uncharacterized repeat protein (TIGR03803 family)